MNNFIFTGTYFDENGDTFVEDTIMDTGSKEQDVTLETVLCDFEETQLFNNSEVKDLDYKSTDELKENEPTLETVLCNFEETYLFNKSEVEDLDYKSTDDFDFDDVQDDDLEYATNNFIERNISLFDYLDEDLADFNILSFRKTNTENHSKKRKRD